MRIRYAAKTDVGMKRTHNEDYFSLMEDEQLFIVMGLYKGGTLKTLMQSSPPALEQSLTIIRDVAAGLANGIVIIDTGTAETLVAIDVHGRGVSDVAFAPDGARIASADGSVVRLWQAQDGRVEQIGAGLAGQFLR